MLSKKIYMLIGLFLFSIAALVYGQEYNWKSQPKKAALMLVLAHPDDEEYFGGTIPYYAVVKKLPIIVICMTTHALIPQRKDEMRHAFWKYGMRNEPIFADFPDCCFKETLEKNWREWGGKDTAVEFLAFQIRKYKPDVIMTHAFDGEYGHPNHMATAYATTEAFAVASDPSMYKEQLNSVDIWKAKKLYIHDYRNYDRITSHSWDMKCTEFDGKTPLEIANEGLKSYKNQGKIRAHPSSVWGLYDTTVGQDTIGKDNFFENVDVSIYLDQDMSAKK